MKIGTLIDKGENLSPSDSPQLQVSDSIYEAVRMFAMATDSRYLPVFEKNVYRGRLYQHRLTQAVVQAYLKQMTERFEVSKQIISDAIKIKNLLKKAIHEDNFNEIYKLIDHIISKQR